MSSKTDRVLSLTNVMPRLQKNIFTSPWRGDEEREERQRHMETTFVQVYQEHHLERSIHAHSARIDNILLTV